MDVLSEILQSVRITGAVFYNAEYSAPWSFRSPASSALLPHLSSASGHVIVYHMITDGRAWAKLVDGDRLSLEAGDLVIFPHDDPHFMGNGAASNPIDHGRHLARILEEGLATSRSGGGGEITRFMCGYLICEPQVRDVVLPGMPRVLKVSIRSDESGQWLENSIRFSVTQAASSNAGAKAVLAKLSEVLFIETLRRYVATLRGDEKGWLAGARDPAVGRALAAIHMEPAKSWTVASLAEAAGVSRSVLAARFNHFLEEPPLTYLTRWRMHLGARLLATSSKSVAEIAGQVGYISEAAFNRAFKREFDVPPARFRKARAAAGSSAG